MRFNVLNDLSASNEEIGVVKMMPGNCEVAVNVVVCVCMVSLALITF